MNLRRCIYVLFLSLALSPPVWAQSKAGPFVLSSASSPCAVIETTAQATIGIKVKGTFTMTLQPEISIQGQTPDNTSVTPYGSQTSQSTITAAGSFTSAVAAGDTFLLCVSAWTSGTATVWLNASTVVAANLLGGGGATNFDTLTSGDNTQAAMQVGTGASLTPTGTGQTTASTDWYSPAGGVVSPPSPGSASNCSSGLNPVEWLLDTASTWQEQACVDTNVIWHQFNGNASPAGILSFTRPVLFNTTGLNPSTTGSQNFSYGGAVGIYNRPSPTGDPAGMFILSDDLSTDTDTYTGGWWGLYSEFDVSGNPTITGIDYGVSALHGTASLQTATGVIQNVPFRGLFGFAERTAGATTAGYPTIIGAEGYAADDSPPGSFPDMGGFFVGGLFHASGGQGHSSTGIAVYAERPDGEFTSLNAAYVVDDYWPTDSTAFAFMNANANIPSVTAGTWILNGLAPYGGAVPFGAAVTGMTSLSMSQVANPSTPIGGSYGTTGSTHYSYAIVALDGNGGSSVASPVVTFTDGNAVLNSSNFELVEFTCEPGVASYNIYRTASGGTPSSTGLIGNLITSLSTTGTAKFCYFHDTGLAGDSRTLPTTPNTTGALNTQKLTTLTNCAAVGTAAATSVVSCGSASAGAIYCDAAASAGTCVVDTTAVTSASEIFITPNGADGTLLSKTCNTLPTVVPFSVLSSKSSGVSFTINMPTVTVNGVCFEYQIVN